MAAIMAVSTCAFLNVTYAASKDHQKIYLADAQICQGGKYYLIDGKKVLKFDSTIDFGRCMLSGKFAAEITGRVVVDLVMSVAQGAESVQAILQDK